MKQHHMPDINYFHYGTIFGAPAVFFTITPCDECSFWVRLYVTCREHSLPSTRDLLDEERCLADFNARKKWRTDHPGACVTEYESMIQIVVQILIGWGQGNHTGNNGIFGTPEAYADCCEEQARYTLHSHITVWVKNFNDVRNLLFHSNRQIRDRAIDEMQSYFNIIAQATLGDLYEIVPKSDLHTPVLRNFNDFLIPPKDQVIRDMRHQFHCLDLHGIVGYHPDNEGKGKENDLVEKALTQLILLKEIVQFISSIKTS